MEEEVLHLDQKCPAIPFVFQPPNHTADPPRPPESKHLKSVFLAGVWGNGARCGHLGTGVPSGTPQKPQPESCCHLRNVCECSFQGSCHGRAGATASVRALGMEVWKGSDYRAIGPLSKALLWFSVLPAGTPPRGPMWPSTESGRIQEKTQPYFPCQGI